MNLKKITSLTMMWTMLIMSYSGIMLFISPPGRIAHWSNWKILGLSKEDYSNIHSTFMVLFIIMTLLHVYYNWKPITSYMKNKARTMIIFTKDMLVAIVFALVFFIGALYEITPFSTFLDFGSGIKNSWEKDYGVAPYSRAELSSLQTFTKKLGYDLEKSKEILKANNIKFEITQTLIQIGNENNLTPQYIYDLFRKNFDKGENKTIPLTGMGKKTISEVATTLNLTSNELILKLKTLGIDAEENDKFRMTAEKYDMSPMDIIKELGYKK